jgi:hypothetical protein
MFSPSGRLSRACLYGVLLLVSDSSRIHLLPIHPQAEISDIFASRTAKGQKKRPDGFPPAVFIPGW